MLLSIAFVYFLAVVASTASAISNPKSLRQIQRQNFRRVTLAPIATAAACKIFGTKKARGATECVCGTTTPGSGIPCVCDAAGLLKNRENFQDWYNPDNERIYDTLHMSFIPARPDQFLSRDLSNKRVIAIGEVHTNPCHHQLQFEILRSLHRMKGSQNLAIGLECFYRQQQRALDRYVFRHNDLETLKYETSWDETWGYDLNNYAKLFQYAARNRIRMIGLNLPYQVAQMVSQSGLDGLSDQIKPLLPPVDLSNEEHQRRFLLALGAAGHSHSHSQTQTPTQLQFSSSEVAVAAGEVGGSTGATSRIVPGQDDQFLRYMYETQTLWDEYMAESAAHFLTEYPQTNLVVIAGLAHIQGRVGIPDRIEKHARRLSQERAAGGGSTAAVAAAANGATALWGALSTNTGTKGAGIGDGEGEAGGGGADSEKPFVIVPQQVAWSAESGLPEISSPLPRTDCDWAWYTQGEIVARG